MTATQAKGHEELVFERWVMRWHPEVARYVTRLVGSGVDSADVLQETWWSAWQAIERGQTPRNQRAWLFGIAHHKAIDALQADSRCPAPALVPESVAAADDPLREVLAREAAAELSVDLLALPEQQRSCLLLHSVAGLSYRDVARSLGLSPIAVKGAVARARGALARADRARGMACFDVRQRMRSALQAGQRLRGADHLHTLRCAGCNAYHATLRSHRRRASALLPAQWLLRTAHRFHSSVHEHASSLAALTTNTGTAGIWKLCGAGVAALACFNSILPIGVPPWDSTAVVAPADPTTPYRDHGYTIVNHAALPAMVAFYAQTRLVHVTRCNPSRYTTGPLECDPTRAFALSDATSQQDWATTQGLKNIERQRRANGYAYLHPNGVPYLTDGPKGTLLLIKPLTNHRTGTL